MKAKFNISSFWRSMLHGIKGGVKGALAGFATGATAGILIAAAFCVYHGRLDMGALALGVALVGGFFGLIGSMAGTMTEVVKSQHSVELLTQDIVTIAKMSYKKGLEAGLSQQQEVETTKWRDQQASEQEAAKTTPGGHTLH